MAGEERGAASIVQDEWDRAVRARRAATRRRLFAAALGLTAGLLVSAVLVPGVLIAILYAIWLTTDGPHEAFFAQWSWTGTGSHSRGWGRGLALLCTPGVMVGLFVYRRLRTRLHA